MYNQFMSNTISITEARRDLPKLVDLADTVAKKTFITVKGKVKAAIISAEELESLEATLEVLSDPKAMEAIKKGEEDIKAGRVHSWEDIKKEYNID